MGVGVGEGVDVGLGVGDGVVDGIGPAIGVGDGVAPGVGVLSNEHPVRMARTNAVAPRRVRTFLPPWRELVRG